MAKKFRYGIGHSSYTDKQRAAYWKKKYFALLKSRSK